MHKCFEILAFLETKVKCWMKYPLTYNYVKHANYVSNERELKVLQENAILQHSITITSEDTACGLNTGT